MATINIYLFGKPSWELDLEQELDKTFVDELSELRENLYDRLSIAGISIETLFKAGWEAYGTLYDVEMCKDITTEEAKKELKELELEYLIENVNEYEDDEE